MAGNTFGTLFTVTTFGESHGEAIGCVVDGCPPGLLLSETDIQPFLDRRKPGQSRHTTQRREADCVRMLSGVFEGKTTGAPIALLIENTDTRSSDYNALQALFRPGHADFTWHYKYGHRDWRGGGRSSARETAARVAAGAIARIWLQKNLGVEIVGYLAQMGDVVLAVDDPKESANNLFFCPNTHQHAQLASTIEALRREGDSTGARVNVLAFNVPIGIGNPVFDRLDAQLAAAMMSINAVKGVEIGDGFEVVHQKGSQHRDEITPQGFCSNHAGGILGGISTGQPLRVSMALKPTSSIVTPGNTINTSGEATTVVTKGRHDPCVGIRAVPIAEAMMALVVMDHYLQHKAQNLQAHAPACVPPWNQ